MYDFSYDKIEYFPYARYRTDSILYYDPIVTQRVTPGQPDSVLVADFSVLRLFKNEDAFATNFPDSYLIIEWTDEDGTRFGEGGTEPGLTISLTELLGAYLSKSGRDFSQTTMDRYNRWEIKLNLAETISTGIVYVCDWEVQYKNVTGGLLPY
jgi:hypothetical protein